MPVLRGVGNDGSETTPLVRLDDAGCCPGGKFGPKPSRKFVMQDAWPLSSEGERLDEVFDHL